MTGKQISLVAATALLLSQVALAWAVDESWRYYRLGNTGMQGDYNYALWIAPDGDPYLSGYDPDFGEGGFTKFIQSESRWVNYSNVDYPAIGHPNEDGCMVVWDIVPDAMGKLWMGTGRGALRFDPAVGPSSLTRFGSGNSSLVDERTFDVERAPDGTLWFANNSCVRYDPTTDTWTHWDVGNVFLAAQPKPGGGYLIWSSTRPPFQDYTFIFDSDTQQWTTLEVYYPLGAPGDVVGLPGKDSVDDAGNLWALRLTQWGDFDRLDYRRPDGTWVAPPEPYPGVTYGIQAFKAYADRRAILVDILGEVYQFDGIGWASLGTWRAGSNTTAADVDAAGNVWVSGVGGAARWDVETGQWQRYRVTNTSNFDSFNRDLTIDPVNGYVYAGANAAPGVGGMVRFDGTRWTCWDQLTYGLGYDWPFGNDYCDALAYRPSNGRVAVNAYWYSGIHEWTGSGFDMLLPVGGAVRMCEDTQGRLWVRDLADLKYFDGVDWTTVGLAVATLVPDPDRLGTVWVSRGYEFVRTDGDAYAFTRTIADFPELPASSFFWGLAAGANGSAWVGVYSNYEGSGLIHINAETGVYEVLQSGQSWPFPSDMVKPWAVSPDGRVWMQYGDPGIPGPDHGLCWYDGTNVGVFPAPPGGEPQWGGLPHAQIEDLEVREIPGGYELWMSCVSRGIAVLSVQYEDPTGVAEGATSPGLLLEPSAPNPFRASTTLSFTLPGSDRVQIGIYDVQGRRIRQLVDERLGGGRNAVAWDGKDDAGRSVVSGVYFWKLRASSGEATQRMVLLR